MRHPKRFVLMLLAIVAIAGLTACGSSDDNGHSITMNVGAANSEKATGEGNGGKSTPTTIVIRNGEPVGGVRELEYSAGEQVRFTVRSNVADEVHVHGYDVEKEVPAGSSATLSFPADLEGIYEVELHESEKQIAELRVNP